MLTIQMIIKLVTGFITILIIIRLLGKRNLSQLTPGDIVYFMVFGGILEQSLYNDKVQFWQPILGLCIWGLIIFLFELLISKSRTLIKWFCCDTEILITDGNIDLKCLKYNIYNM